MGTNNPIVGKLMASYWPHEEPEVVVVLSVTPGEECLVRTANSSSVTGSRLEYLREFDLDEFSRAYNKYWRDEYARRSSNCALLAKENHED